METTKLQFTTINQAMKQNHVSYLAKCNSSSKIMKNKKVLNIDTYILHLAPYKSSGYQVCPMATKDCVIGCLNTSGRAGMEIIANNETRIINSRIKKTRLFFENREYFMNWLISDIKKNMELSHKKGNGFAVRLNGTSDINWNAVKLNGKTVFEYFPDIQFYDYTKVPNRFDNIPKNYYLTFSYSGSNWNDCVKILNMGYNVAVVFDIMKFYNSVNLKPLPITFKGYNVIDGDITDYRPIDKRGVIVGLHWKRIVNKQINATIRKSIFVVNPKDKDCNYQTVTKKVIKNNIIESVLVLN